MNILTWYRVSNALARDFIAFPGGLLAAYGLREHAIKRIAPSQKSRSSITCCVWPEFLARAVFYLWRVDYASDFVSAREIF